MVTEKERKESEKLLRERIEKKDKVKNYKPNLKLQELYSKIINAQEGDREWTTQI